jgi:hypothetical protein
MLAEISMTYQPQPLDTSQTPLPPALKPLVEQLAENVHEQWSLLRISQGWQYGPQRDDAHKHHPCLIPYADLPESEKEYDRRTVEETVRAICLLGYRIEKSGD